MRIIPWVQLGHTRDTCLAKYYLGLTRSLVGRAHIRADLPDHLLLLLVSLVLMWVRNLQVNHGEMIELSLFRRFRVLVIVHLRRQNTLLLNEVLPVLNILHHLNLDHLLPVPLLFLLH